MYQVLQNSMGDFGSASERSPTTVRKSICVGVAGLPNAGKSTLVNRFAKKKIAIATDRPQTTRVATTCQVRVGQTQILFTDAPGLFRPERPLEKIIVKNAIAAVRESDVLLFIVDIRRCEIGVYERTIDIITSAKKPIVCALNKADLLHDPVIASDFVKKLQERLKWDSVFHVSALLGTGVSPLLRRLSEMATPGRWRQCALPDALFAACEITREHLFNELYQELPYSIAITTESWAEHEDCIEIRQSIHVASSKHKPILIGKNGSLLKKVGSAARLELSGLFGKSVALFLHVNVKEDWQNRPDAGRLISTGRVT